MADKNLEPRQCCPPRWRVHVFEKSWRVAAPQSAVWGWLNDPATFTRQVWPYRVEFLPGSGIDGASGFAVGVLNAHHGPLLNASGVITAIDDGANGVASYRDLWYCYGSFVVGMRFARPTRLQFWVDGDEHAASVRVQLDVQIAPWFTWAFARGNAMFWSAFPSSMRRGVRRHAASIPHHQHTDPGGDHEGAQQSP